MEKEEKANVSEASQEWGERVVAYIVISRPVEIEELRSFLGDKLAPYKPPRALPIVDALPRNALGKVQKHRLQNGSVVPG